jgi:hypothetical protein
MEVVLPFPSDVVRFVFRAMNQYHASGRFPIFPKKDFLQVLEFSLYIGFDKFLKELASRIGECLLDIVPDTLSRFPLFLRSLVLESIPISRLDPDLIIAHFGFELLSDRIQKSIAPKMNEIPFVFFTAIDIPDGDPNNQVANMLMHYDTRFLSSPFVSSNCTQLSLKAFVNISHFTGLRELSLTTFPVQQISLHLLFVPSLRRLEITKTKLEEDHVKEILAFLTTNSLECLLLRETKLGAAKCSLITAAIDRHEIGPLKYLDVSSNAIGADAIDKLLEAASKAHLEGIAVDANFFTPSAHTLRHFVGTPHAAISLRGIHWDGPSADTVAKALKSPGVKFWDLSAQVIHQHSDPDLSVGMAEFVMRDCSPDIEALFFSNHKLTGFNAGCLVSARLRALTISNSGIQADSLDSMIPLLNSLSFLDLSHNSITFREFTFLAAVVASPTMRCLFLSNNEIGDSLGARLFHAMLESDSELRLLRFRNCQLGKLSSSALIKLLGTGAMSFDEIDLGGNEMFHTLPDVWGPFQKSRVECLFIGANNPTFPALERFLSAISDLRFIDFDRTPFKVVLNCAPCIVGVTGLSVCFARIADERGLFELLTTTRAHEIWLVHSLSQAMLEALMVRFREIPFCMAIHIGLDLDLSRIQQTIPLILEGSE